MGSRKAQNKTQATVTDVAGFIAQVDPARRRDEAEKLNELFKTASGFAPKIWGSSLIGYGRYHYTYASGREGEFLATGFAPRKARLSIYIMPGYQDYSQLLSRLGKHKHGKSCLYINKLDDVDLTVLSELVEQGLKDLNKTWTVHPI